MTDEEHRNQELRATDRRSKSWSILLVRFLKLLRERWGTAALQFIDFT